MGVIKHKTTEKHLLLRNEHVFGRSASRSNTIVKGPDISRSHATILWNGFKWVLKDHSTNGTLVNQSLSRQASADLKQGDVIKFGQIAEMEWIMVSDDPPISFLQKADNPEEILALASRPGISSPEHPGISFYLGSDNRWKAELMGMVIDLVDGAKLKLGDEELIFRENDGFTTTLNLGARYSRAIFAILLSPDEERIAIEIRDGDWIMDMGERVHNYLLLLLARKRLADQKAGFHDRDQGWMDVETVVSDMSKEFQKTMDEYQINLQIFRIRKQLLNLKPFGYLFSNVIERRKGEMRFAQPYIQIWKEGEVLDGFTPE